MSLHPQPIGPVPEDTDRVARVALKGRLTYQRGMCSEPYTRMRISRRSSKCRVASRHRVVEVGFGDGDAVR